MTSYLRSFLKHGTFRRKRLLHAVAQQKFGNQRSKWRVCRVPVGPVFREVAGFRGDSIRDAAGNNE